MNTTTQTASQTLRFKQLHPKAQLPARGSQHAAGLDLFAAEEATIAPRERYAVRTGVSVEIPHGFYGRVAPRSGLARDNGIDVLAGVIDSDYRGEILCMLVNHGATDKVFKVGDRIAQLIIEAIITPTPEWSDDLETTRRGDGGFGSTGA